MSNDTSSKLSAKVIIFSTRNINMLNSPNIMCSRAKAWKAAPAKELNRLGSDNKTSNWMLPCGILDERTRGKKKTDDSLSNDPKIGDDEENDADNVLSPIDMNAEEGEKAEEEDEVNDDPTRALLELDCLRSLLCRTAKCGKCGSGVKVAFKLCGINTHCKMKCVNAPRGCSWEDSSGKGALTEFLLPAGSGSPLIERTTDYASNVLYDISNLSVGDGGREAERHLTFLGLPNSTAMERSTFKPIEERIAPSIGELNGEILKENLIVEVEGIMRSDEQSEFDTTAFEVWKSYTPTVPIDAADAILPLPKIVVSADMCTTLKAMGFLFVVKRKL